ncbi:MAG: hypothetical protein ACREN1_01295 [Candidatus Dormibacteria bacterium]
MATAAERARRDRRIHALADTGLSTRAIARRVGTSPPNVCRVLAASPAGAEPGNVAARPTTRPAEVAGPRAADPAEDPGGGVRQAEVEGYRQGLATSI